MDKVHRYSRPVVVTEKIDGTQGTIIIERHDDIAGYDITVKSKGGHCLTVEKDNYGFCRWVFDHQHELIDLLGEGIHVGEWWGKKIQRGYNQTERHFSLFNTKRWRNVQEESNDLVRCVPVLWEGNFDDLDIKCLMHVLKKSGSLAALGFNNPEGIVIYHTVADVMFKKTFEHDADGKGYNR